MYEAHWDDHELLSVDDGEYIMNEGEEYEYVGETDVEDGWYWVHKEDGPRAGPFRSSRDALEWVEKLL